MKAQRKWWASATLRATVALTRAQAGRPNAKEFDRRRGLDLRETGRLRAVLGDHDDS